MRRPSVRPRRPSVQQMTMKDERKEEKEREGEGPSCITASPIFGLHDSSNFYRVG